MTEISVEPFAHADVDGLIALVTAEGWTEYADDEDRTDRALTAPGATTPVATVGGSVVGAVQFQLDGLIQAHVSMLLIDRRWRGVGLGSRLLCEGLKRAREGCNSTYALGPRGTTSASVCAARSASA